MLSRIGATTPFAWLFAAYVVFGIGFGFVNAPITNAAVSGCRVPRRASPRPSPDLPPVGSTLGVAVVGSLLAVGPRSFGRRARRRGRPTSAGLSWPGAVSSCSCSDRW